MNLSTIFFIGPQGSGKGTQAKILAQRLGFFHWDNGAILREVAQVDSDLGRRVKQLLEAGIYLSDELLFEVATYKLESLPVSRGVIFDGLPRRLSQAQFMMDFLKKQGRANFATIFLDVPRQESLKRLLHRAKTQGRTDDTPEVIERRLQQYYDETLPILEFMKQHGEFIEIDGTPAIAEVTEEINLKLGLD